MQPHDRAPDIEETRVETIPLLQVDSGHPSSASTRIALVVTLHCLFPEVTNITGTVLPKANIDQEFAELVTHLVIRSGSFASPQLDTLSNKLITIPAT
jgi:hypothetical protein